MITDNAAEMEEYLDRVGLILRKMNKDKEKEEHVGKILSGLNGIGRTYFGKGYIDSITDVDYDIEVPVEALTQAEFKERYEEETNDALDGDEASFSDAYRHAALIDVDTLEVFPLEVGTDYVFTWDMIHALPAKLAGTRLVAIHIDTEGGPQVFFPIPGQSPIGKM